ncbi:TonB-dependent receptor [Pontibacter sp. SGAir0037]|uniref:TonB-dependent receptor n=1 Tax=Pontibacter sp. SGAir0037 TaxID=2571030 RepID=UPI0010CCB8FC|nr:TonB-dependent receptor [Pontibacter sp. SGAir0037]QCR24136.1 TonB-dependent receptor [Pontibacter sp. SGAir0037]
MIQRFTSLLILLCLAPLMVLAQQATTVSGIVLDSKGEAVPGANVFIKGSYDGTSSRTDGSFAFETDESGTKTVVASFLGYEQQELPVTLSGKEVIVSFKLKEKLSQLNTVVITAGAFEAGDEKRSTILSSLDVATTAGATADIYAALQSLPGTQRVGDEGKLFVRGGDSYEAKSFIDGLLVQKPYNSSVPDLPARGRFSPFMFSGISFSSGGYSAEYGQALSSALILKSNGLAETTESGISIMSIGLGASHTQRWDNTSLSLTADYTNMQPYVGLVKQNIAWQQAPESKGGSFVLRHKTDKGMLKAYSSYSNSYLELDQLTADGQRHVAIQNSNFFNNLTYQGLLNDKWTLYAGAGYTSNQDVLQVEQEHMTEQDQAIQGKVMLEHQLATPLWLKFGSELVVRGYEQQYTQSPAHSTLTPGFTDYLAAAFTEADWYISKRLVTRIGIRTENSTVLEKGNVAPRISIAYKTDEHSQLSAAYGQFYQLPEAEFLKINRHLSYESATHYILNYQHQQDNRTFRVEGYYKQYNDLVKYNESLRYTPSSYNNNGTGYARGIDFFWRDKKSIRNGDYWISYSLLDTKRDYRNYTREAVPTFASTHNLSVVYKHFLPKLSTQLSATYAFGSGRPYHNPTLDGYNQSRTPNYNDLSLNASYLTSLWGNFTVIYLSATNVLGNSQVFGYRYASTPDESGAINRSAVTPAAKRFLFAGVFINFGGKSIHH